MPSSLVVPSSVTGRAAGSGSAVPPSVTKQRVLVIGGGLAGLAAARELCRDFVVTVVDAKEYFEYTPGVMRAFAKPDHWDALTFMYHEVLERKLSVRFIWGEVLDIDCSQRCVVVKTMFSQGEDRVPYDFCLVAGGCNFNQQSASGESLWCPTVHERDRAASSWNHLDERFLEGRRRRVLEEHLLLEELNSRHAQVLIVGAGFMGVEWACELRHFFPQMQIMLTDFLPNCLGPRFSAEAAQYCEEYMQEHDIRTCYETKFDPSNPEFLSRVGLSHRPERVYMFSGVKQSNYFMHKTTLSDFGPGGGGWILVNRHLQVTTRSGQLWGEGRVFAVGDCNVGCVGDRSTREVPQMPKTGYPAEQQAVHACRNIKTLDRAWHGKGGRLSVQPSLLSTWYPWGAGIFAISLGTEDGVVICGAQSEKHPGRLFTKGRVASAQKDLIEYTKLQQCRGEGALSKFAWYLIHHWPVNLCGNGPLCSWI